MAVNNIRVTDYPAYRRLHIWVIKQLGKPNFCVACKTTTAKHYDWANISGEYKQDLNDFQRMCRKCHMKMDLGSATECSKGHPFSGDNLILHRRGDRRCRICKNTQNLAAYYRHKEDVLDRKRSRYAIKKAKLKLKGTVIE